MFSDYPPPFVYPSTDEGLREANKLNLNERGLIYFCHNFEDVSPFYMQSEHHLPVKRPCENRRLGDDEHNWCLRCVSGYPVTLARR